MAHPRERSDMSTTSQDTTFSEAIDRLDETTFALGENRRENRAPSKGRKQKDRSYDDQPEHLDVITEGAERLSFGDRPNFTAKQVLFRNLSVRSAVSTGSSFAELMDFAQRHPGEQVWREIGRGSYGTVYELTGTIDVIKAVQMLGEAVEHDYSTQRTMFHSVNKAADTVSQVPGPRGLSIVPARVPQTHYFCTMGTTQCAEFFENATFEKHQPSTSFFRAERILPLPKETRHCLIEAYFPLEQQHEAILNPANKACIARIYLGCRTAWLDRQDPHPTLQNFPLYVDQLEDLGLEIEVFAAEMALSYAIAHFVAYNDLNDAEFVLGSSAENRIDTAPNYTVEQCKKLGADAPKFDFRKRSTHLWLTDFDKTAKIERSIEGMRQAANAAEKNDPYAPKPPSSISTATDDSLWLVFASTYLKASKAILTEQYGPALALTEGGSFLKKLWWKDQKSAIEKIMDLPQVFLDEWKALRETRVGTGIYY